MSISIGLGHYFNNKISVLSFLLLLVFVFPILYLAPAFATSGSLFLDYNFLNADPLQTIFLLALVVVFLFVYSTLVTLAIFAVRREMGKVKMHYYLTEKIRKFAVKCFIFNVAFVIVAGLIMALLFQFDAPIIYVNVLLFVAALAFIFLPQSIVVDEDTLESSIQENFEFILAHIPSVVYVLVVGVVLYLIAIGIEFLADIFFFAGWVVSMLFILLFVIPFIEMLKTQVYIDNKYELARVSHRYAIHKEMK